MEKYTNTACPLHGSTYCALLHMQSCESCTVHTATADQVSRLKADLDVTASLMPEDGVSALFMTDQCLLCKGEPGARAYYANVDIGNQEPKHEQRNVIGIKTIARTGSMVPLQVACCKDCRRRILQIEYLPTCLMVFVCALALFLMSIRPLRESLMRGSAILPFAIFAGVVIAALVAGNVLRNQLIKQAGEKTHLSVFDLPSLSGMRENGWFELNPGKAGVTRYVFAKKRIRQGLYTGAPEETPEKA